MACELELEPIMGQPGQLEIFCVDHGYLGQDERDFIREIWSAHLRNISWNTDRKENK